MLCSYLLLVVQTLVVVLEDGHAFRAARCVFVGGVDDVAGEHFLPEREASPGTCEAMSVSDCSLYCLVTMRYVLSVSPLLSSRRCESCSAAAFECPIVPSAAPFHSLPLQSLPSRPP